MNLKSLIKELNKFKKYGDMPVLYMYGNKSELTFVELGRVELVYIPETVEIVDSSFSFKELSEIDFKLTAGEGYTPYILVTEVNL